MATNWHNVKGFAYWAKVYEPDSYNGQENYKITLYFKDDKELESFKKIGLELQIKEDDNGKFVTFRRPRKKTIKDDIVFFSPPEVRGKVSVKYIDDKGEVIRQYNKGEHNGKLERDGEATLIGNGSKVSVNICVYDTAKGKGHRLESVTIYELVEYVPTDTWEDNDPEPEVKKEEEKPKKTSEKLKEALKDETSGKKTSIKEDLNDDIPW